MDYLDDIREASRIGYSESRSITEALLDARWCSTEDLQIAFDMLEEWESPSAVTFFQLLYPIRLPERWIDCRRSGKQEARVFFRTIGTGPNIIDRKKVGGSLVCRSRQDFGGLEEFVNAWIPGDRTGRLVCTQVLIIFRLWGWHAEMFPLYQDALARRLSLNKPIPFRGGYLKHDGIPVTSSNYETMLARRLREESLKVMEYILPLYAVACLDPNATYPSYLHNFFTMICGGRLVVLGPGHSFLASSVRPFEFGNHGKNLSSLLTRLTSPRSISVYENYLLQAVRQVEEGEPSLAVVYTVMILDWFANEMIRAHLIPIIERNLRGNPDLLELVRQRIWPEGKEEKHGRRHVPVPEKLLEYLPLIGIKLRDPLKRSVRKIITKRNDIIHTNQTQIVDKEEALEVIRVGMQFINTVIIELQKLFTLQDGKTRCSVEEDISSIDT